VLTGAWHLPRQKRLLLLFANVSDQPVAASWDFQPETYGRPNPSNSMQRGAISGERVVAQNELGPVEMRPFDLPPQIARPVTFGPRSIEAWEWRY